MLKMKVPRTLKLMLDTLIVLHVGLYTHDTCMRIMPCLFEVMRPRQHAVFMLDPIPNHMTLILWSFILLWPFMVTRGVILSRSFKVKSEGVPVLWKLSYVVLYAPNNKCCPNGKRLPVRAQYNWGKRDLTFQGRQRSNPIKPTIWLHIHA